MVASSSLALGRCRSASYAYEHRASAALTPSATQRPEFTPFARTEAPSAPPAALCPMSTAAYRPTTDDIRTAVQQR
jgi:hypothetical protein